MTSVFHPATVELVWLQSRGRRRRLWARFCEPRRLLLSAIACLLTVFWLGNVAMTIWLREPAAIETLRALLSWSLVVYLGWHVASAAFFRPESPLDLAPGEQEILLALPLSTRDLVAYQFASVTVTTLLKAGLATLLLLPDLRCVLLAFVGMLLAMLLLELVRMAIQTAAWGVSHRTFLVYRTIVLLVVLVGGIAASSAAVRGLNLYDPASGNGFRQRLVHVLIELQGTPVGSITLPFKPFVDLITAESVTPANLALAVVAFAMVAALVAGVIGLYAITTHRVAVREQRVYDRNVGTMAAKAAQSKAGSLRRLEVRAGLPRIPRCGGAVPLLWRQLLGARRRWGSLLTAMIAPAVLAAAPCFSVADSHIAFLMSAGALAFYTFLLLPTALRFDFRRDLDRLATLKSLPIGPLAAAAGQTLAPILLTTLFQCAVLAFVIAARSLSPMYLLLTMLIMTPLNALVFGIDNLIYLLYPYRVQQEGLEIFLRTMLTFTGKGLLFTAGLVAMSAWGVVATALADRLPPSAAKEALACVLFVGGMIAGLSLLAAGVLLGLARTYRSLNPIEDIPR